MSTEATGSAWEGTVVDGEYTLLQRLGSSGSTSVFLAEPRGHPGQKVVVKFVSADAAEAEDRISGWALAASLSHPHLMRLMHTGRCRIGADPLLYSVTEYAEEVLTQILPERPLTTREAGEMLDPVLAALSYLHGRGILHGHLKPSNIMVVDDRLKLSSDGLQAAGKPASRSQPPSVYSAPETGAGPISPAADVWSLGVTLVEAMTQHPPVWDRSKPGDPAVPGSIPQPFAGIARACLRCDPARRCTLSDVMARLQGAPSAPGTGGETGRAAHARRRRLAIAAAALVPVAVAVTIMLRPNRVELGHRAGEEPAPQVQGLTPQPPVPGTQSSGATVKGAVTARVLPDVLPSATESIQGQVNVAVRVTVDPDGNVSQAAFDSPGPSKYFSKVAMEAAQRWKFKPAQVDGQAVSSVWVIQFHFTQTATDVTSVETSP